MSNAIGNIVSSGSSSALNSGAANYDVTKWGAISGVNDTLRTAINNIVAQAVPGNPICFYLPAGSYTIYDSIWLPSVSCSIIGEDPVTTLIFGYGLPALICGMPNEFGYLSLTSGHWPSLSGIMDSSWGPSAKGFAIYDPATGLIKPDLRYLYYQATTLTQGLNNDHWTKTNKFTLEFAVRCRTAAAGAGASPLGPGIPPLGFGFNMPNYTQTSMPRPWSIAAEGWQATITSCTTNSISFTQSANALGINGGNMPNGALVQITTGTGAGQINQIASFTSFSAGVYTYALANNWGTLPTAGATATIVGGLALLLDIATTLLDDGQIPGYDPSQDGTLYSVGLTFPVGMTLPSTAATSIWRFKVQLDMTASTAANFAQGWVSCSGSAAGNFGAMAVVGGAVPAHGQPAFR